MSNKENEKYYEQQEERRQEREPMHTPTPWEYDMRRDTHDSIIFKSGSKEKDGFIHQH